MLVEGVNLGNFKVAPRKLGSCAAQIGMLRRDWRLGVRLGPHASGIHSQRIYDLHATHPGIRKAGFREVLGVLGRPGQVG